MIILPDKNIPRAKFLLPIPDRVWREPSQAEQKNWLGHTPVVFSFQAQARRHGRLLWEGHFRDRQDFDEFCWAAAVGSLRYDRYIQRLPHPELDPNLFGDEEITLHFLTTSIITSGTSWPVPPDCSGVSGKTGEFIDTIGAGGSGAACGQNGPANGGCGGAWSRNTGATSPVVLTPSGSATIQIGTGGAAVSAASAAAASGNAGTNTWFNGASLAAASVGALGGSGGNFNTSLVALGAIAGPLASGRPNTANTSGNNGGGVGGSAAVSSPGVGGGGAAGLNGAGVSSPQHTSAGGGSAGGAGDNGSGGAAGAAAGDNAAGNAGGNGAEYSTAGSGGGGGGGGCSTTGAAALSAGNGGLYGAGGGGRSHRGGGNTATSGVGRNGLIVVRYEPAAAASGMGFNMPMLGF